MKASKNQTFAQGARLISNLGMLFFVLSNGACNQKNTATKTDTTRVESSGSSDSSPLPSVPPGKGKGTATGSGQTAPLPNPQSVPGPQIPPAPQAPGQPQAVPATSKAIENYIPKAGVPNGNVAAFIKVTSLTLGENDLPTFTLWIKGMYLEQASSFGVAGSCGLPDKVRYFEGLPATIVAEYRPSQVSGKSDCKFNLIARDGSATEFQSFSFTDPSAGVTGRIILDALPKIISNGAFGTLLEITGQNVGTADQFTLTGAPGCNEFLGMNLDQDQMGQDISFNPYSINGVACTLVLSRSLDGAKSNAITFTIPAPAK